MKKLKDRSKRIEKTVKKTDRRVQLTHNHVDAGMIGAPKDIVINDDKVTGDRIAFVENILVNTLHIVDSN